MEDFTIKQLMDELRQVNLCTYYLLPITGLTRFSFGEGVFLNSYLERNRRWIIVHVPDLLLVPTRITSHAIKVWSNDDGGFLAYEISPCWWTDIELFVEGKYSTLSEDLKKIIFDRSGLPYKEPAGINTTVTDIRLQALEGREAVRVYLERELGVSLAVEAEVLGPPPITSFMDVEER